MSNIKLIVGLANPGAEYAQTRHNAGAWYVQELARLCNVSLVVDSKYFGVTARVTLHGRDVRLLIPTTFMNLSGKSVAALANFFRILPEEILVAHDELDMDPGVAKFKLGGGHGGHNGLKDIIASLGNDKNFHRLRIGIGHPGDKNKVSGYVLGRAPALEQERIIAAIDEAVRSTEILFKQDMAKAMHRLHTFKAE
ncbi:MAG: aminoacyl-tRNA hydrolase [Shewanella psychromarinicola]|jgi:PTH1 family peptidyl-tRNA hydrolase|uniref:Peptidyl-tRNA hydrolase n=1 Tax=Shewanella psychromarinicola TaxID=2487742 RepID=A0A3N4E855_9GAMM|nr:MULTISPECIES: aminoacyl-tRNA hydrolase [Shewanella]AZG35076.1 aminoacyl-tRNA hydrolase [Shewanella psychromarinicola]MCL1082730.1 aminoacyl-tRNA hydrolase [Shewanella psychromarinicola]PKG80119.1 aminoacyl-tRNA hydrolase [Shewanella sp. Actino-trap-3]RPA33126.1 aminoacyl-tRNA hydrolase [Shewanella psychromarinicola]|tara:strand:+ start:31974 stop:32561 length:588 start_codon:yes stop_codon:yes gene_type:complete